MSIYLETRRLVLRELTEGDANRLLALDSDPEVLHWTGARGLANVQAYRRHVRTNILCYYVVYEGYGFWAILEKASGRFVGWTSLRPALDGRFAAALKYAPEDVELDCRLQRAVWGQGFATELVLALVQKAFLSLGTMSVVAATAREHAVAQHILQKAGLRQLQGPFTVPNQQQPWVKYGLTQAQFLRIHARRL
jgi:RimJ/RimL family protein N-acetyltransferase